MIFIEARLSEISEETEGHSTSGNNRVDTIYQTSTSKNANLQISKFAEINTQEDDKTTKLMEEILNVTNEPAVAKPLEPKPTLVNLMVSHVSGAEGPMDYTDILIGVSSLVTASLTGLLLTILYKLYQTFQTTPAPSPAAMATSRSNFSVNTDNTEVENMLPLASHHFDNEVIPSNFHPHAFPGTLPSKSKSVVFDLEPSSYQLSVSTLSRDQQIASNSSGGDCLRADKGASLGAGRQEMMSDPSDKWQFPRVPLSPQAQGNKLMQNKYLSL